MGFNWKAFPRLLQAVLILLIVLSATQSKASTPEDIGIDRNGVLLKGKFYVSEGAGTFPTVILLHGFPGNETDVLGLGEKLSQAGINVLTFNYSGTYKSQGDNSFSNTQIDIHAALGFIHQPKNILKYKIDTTRIYLGGWSYGGGMALTFAATHTGITKVFSIAGTDHGEFMREYMRNAQFQKMIDDIFKSLMGPKGPVRAAIGSTPKETVELGMDKFNPIFDLREGASALAEKDVLLIGGWDDANVTMDHHVLPLYRAIKNEQAKNIKIVAFQDDHSFKNYRAELAQTIIDWLNSGQVIK